MTPDPRDPQRLLDLHVRAIRGLLRHDVIDGTRIGLHLDAIDEELALLRAALREPHPDPLVNRLRQAAATVGDREEPDPNQALLLEAAEALEADAALQ